MLKPLIRKGEVFTRKINNLLMAALLIALDVIFSRLLAVYTPGGIDRLSLQFLPNALAGYLFGPFLGGAVLVAGDMLGSLVVSRGLAVSSLFTVSALAKGLIYGFMLNNKKPTVKRVFFTFLIAAIVVDVGLDTAWLTMLRHLDWGAVLAQKILTRSVFLIAQTVLFSLISKPIANSY
ncbi:MAG: folate family ECF transporter S component [Bacillota bacterium]|nr:folate family ECF transporter S component [Bacillota bacterium]